MFLLQLKYETLRLMRSPALWLLLAFLSASVWFGLYNGMQRVEAKKLSVGQQLASQKEILLLQKMQADSISRGLITSERWWVDPTNVIVVGGMWRGGWVTTLESHPEEVLAAGLGDLQPSVWRLLLTGKEAWGDSIFENPENLASGHFDLAFILSFLLPLLTIALSFNLISADREQGTLVLQLAQPVAFGRMFFYKMLARFTVLAVLTLLVVLPAIAWAGVPLYAAAAWQTAAVAILYTLFWFVLSLGINLLGRSSAQNALLCTGAWLAFALIVPALVNMWAQRSHPIPSRAGYQTASRELEKYLQMSREARLDAYYRQHPEIPRKSEEEKDWKDEYREEFALLPEEQGLRDSLEQQFSTKAERQADFAEKFTLLSPALSVHRQMTDLAGTSRRAFQANLASVDEAQKSWASWFMNKFEKGESLEAEDYDAFMQFPEKVARAALPNAHKGLLVLSLQCLLIGIWVWWVAAQNIRQRYTWQR